MVSWTSIDPVAGIAGSTFGSIAAMVALTVVVGCVIIAWSTVHGGVDDDDD